MHTEKNPNANTKKTPLSIHQIAMTGLMAALLCFLGPLSIPIGPVPISFTNFALYLIVYLLNTKLALLSFCIYLLIGILGLPVFSGYSGGLGKLAGPTGGYLVGFLFLVLIAGFFVHTYHTKTSLSIVGMALGTFVAYLFGAIWFALEAKCTLWYAFTVCVLPFILGDIIKILLASHIGPMIRNALQKAHLLEHLT